MKKINIIILTLLAIYTFYSYFGKDKQSKSKTIDTPKQVPSTTVSLNESVDKKHTSITIDSANKNDQKSIKSTKVYEVSLEELDTLVMEAVELISQNKIDDAIALYKEIIEKSRHSKDKDAIFYGVIAHGVLANLYSITDKDDAISEFEKIQAMLEDKNDSESVSIYIGAGVSKSKLMGADQGADVRDALMERFRDNKDVAVQSYLEGMEFDKSFDLMSKDGNEAMDLLDGIIEKYRDKQPNEIPLHAKNSLINNIELSMITGQDDSEYRDLAKTYLKDMPDAEPLLEMLSIIKDSQNSNQDGQMLAWLDNHSRYKFNDWSFSEMDRWSNQIENPESKQRVQFYIDSFQKHMEKNN